MLTLRVMTALAVLSSPQKGGCADQQEVSREEWCEGGVREVEVCRDDEGARGDGGNHGVAATADPLPEEQISEHDREEGLPVLEHRRVRSGRASDPHVEENRCDGASDAPEEQEDPPISPDEHAPPDGWEEQKAGDELTVETQFDGAEALVE